MSKFRLAALVAFVLVALSLPTAAADSSTVIVKFKSSRNHILQKHKTLKFESRAERARHLRSMLSDHAATTHAQLLEELSMFPHIEAKSMWICNAVLVNNCSTSILRFINSMSFVAEAREEKLFPLPHFTPVQVDKGQIQSVQWGVARIMAPEVWDMNPSNTGEQIVVASIDTGVAPHEALDSNYLGDEVGWLDAVSGEPTHFDDIGHGTHTTATAVGREGVGVAPGALWGACKACSDAGCSESDLLECGQFVLTIEPLPNVVINSWGGGQGDDFFNDVIDAWTLARIIPVFAIGNNGPDCSTAHSPGDQINVIGVGATTIQDNIAEFSSRGPSVQDIPKPDISAPGQDIISASNTGPQDYVSLSGTSMACPHVAGAVALLLAQNPNLDLDGVVEWLDAGADTESLAFNDQCGGTSEFPNNIYGSGLVNIFDSIEAMLGDQVKSKSSKCSADADGN